MDKRLIFVACCLSAVYAIFPPTCELECVAGYIGDIAECRVDFPYKPAGPNKDLQLCLLEVESDRNICMVMNRDPACQAKAATSTMHLPFKMNLTQLTTTTPVPTTTTTTTTTQKPSTAPLQVGPALSQPSHSSNHLIQLYVDPHNQQTAHSPYGLVGRPSQAHYSPVAVEPMPMKPPSGLTVAQARRHQQIQNMIQRSAPQASVSQRPVPSPQVQSGMQLPARPMPKQMQLPSQRSPQRLHLPPRPGPQPRVAPQQQQSYSVARTNPKIIQRRLTVYKLAKPFKPNAFSSPQQSFSAGNLFIR